MTVLKVIYDNAMSLCTTGTSHIYMHIYMIKKHNYISQSVFTYPIMISLKEDRVFAYKEDIKTRVPRGKVKVTSSKMLRTPSRLGWLFLGLIDI